MVEPGRTKRTPAACELIVNSEGGSELTGRRDFSSFKDISMNATLPHVLFGAAAAIGAMTERIAAAAQESDVQPEHRTKALAIASSLAQNVEALTQLAEETRKEN